MSKKSTLGKVLVLSVVAALAMFSPAWGGLQTYRDYSLGTLGMIVQSMFYDEANLFVIGESSTPGVYQTAMLISKNADLEDGGGKNAILFECGMHGREWFASESCYWLIDYLLQKRDTPVVQDLLRNADVWVIPQSNPAGRMIDDLRWGDPTRFYYFCDGGLNIGQPCSADTDCTPGGACWTVGWRSNANTDDCDLAVDPARNFSAGWDDATRLCENELCVGGTSDGLPCPSGGCTGGTCKNRRMWYRGPNPFSEPETLNLRRFVHNHMISMAAVVHTNGQTMENLWYDYNDATKYMVDHMLVTNSVGSLRYAPSPAMERNDGLGTGSGQFSAWLSERSDVPGAPDSLTSRHISTFYFELPVKDSIYMVPYQNRADDGSNSFHPSGDIMRSLWEDTINPLFLYLVRQARSPQCPVLFGPLRVDEQCSPTDFGLVGAKIADTYSLPGLLDYDTGQRSETLPKGVHRVVFSVQNFSSADQSPLPSQTHANVRITTGAVVVDNPVDIVLMPGNRGMYSVEYDFDYGDYRVQITLDPDDFDRNNTKVFTFTVPSLHMGRAQVRLGTSTHRISPDGSWNYNARFPADRQLNPSAADLKITLYGRRSRIPNTQMESSSLSCVLPKGSKWWSKSVPAQGLWIYSDPKRTNGPVSYLMFRQPPKGKLNPKSQIDINLTAKGDTLKTLYGAQSYSVDLDFAEGNLRLSTVALGTRPPHFPRKLLPMGETEEEPDGPPSPNQNQ